MKKRGFTLVELLAVIAILAILVIMALPAVLRMFNQARKDSFTNEVNTVIRTAKQQYLLEGGESQVWTNAEGSTNTLDLTGNSNLKYSITIDNIGNVTSVQVTNGDFQYSKTGVIDIADKNDVQVVSELDEEKIIEIKKPIEFITRQNSESITVGDEIAINTEHFYVVSSNSTETLLLAKYNLQQDGSNYVQVNNGTTTDVVKVNFLDSNNIAYWDKNEKVWNGSNWSNTNATGGLKDEYSAGGKAYCTVNSETNCAYVYDSNAVIYQIVNAYIISIRNIIGSNANGRLLSLEEAYTFKNSGSLGEREIKSMNNVIYWLGSAPSATYAWFVNGTGMINSNPPYYKGGVRPAIVMPTNYILN